MNPAPLYLHGSPRPLPRDPTVYHPPADSSQTISPVIHHRSGSLETIQVLSILRSSNLSRQSPGQVAGIRPGADNRHGGQIDNPPSFMALWDIRIPLPAHGVAPGCCPGASAASLQWGWSSSPR